MNTENKYNIRDYLGKEVLFFDGGTGSVLQARGLKPGELPENWNIEKPEEIVQLNYNYFLAGSNIVNTNSFGAFSTKFTGKDGSYSLEQIVTAAVENAKEARRRIYEKDEEGNIKTDEDGNNIEIPGFRKAWNAYDTAKNTKKWNIA